MLAKNTFKIAANLRHGRRMFSNVLLAPLHATPEVPAVMNEGFLVSKHYDRLLQEKYDAFNEKCKKDLQQMNENKIDNIISRGGTEGW